MGQGNWSLVSGLSIYCALGRLLAAERGGLGDGQDQRGLGLLGVRRDGGRGVGGREGGEEVLGQSDAHCIFAHDILN